jgi:hypothetical protein
MKTLNWIFFFATLVTGITAQGQSTLEAEVPGDNFSLEGALELFKKSASPEEFERMLNSANSKVNNLDLNNDGNTDYIKVIDRNEGNVHAFILQSVISQTESQDVAVIELEKLQDGKATLQITGDADIYGIETIIEPSEEVRVNAGTTTVRNVVNVWTWPSVQYVYGPYYNQWVSPWSYSYYPVWWSPWSPVAFYVYSPWWRPYRPYYSFCYSHRIGYLPRLYNPYRCSSSYVYNNCHGQINQYRSNYNNGRSRYDGNHGHQDGGRHDGYGGRTRSDYYDHRGSDNGRQYASSNGGSHRDGGRDHYNNGQNQYTDRSRGSNDRSFDHRSSSDYRSSRGQSQGNSNFQQGNTSTQRSYRHSQGQRQSSSSFNNGGQQRSSSFGSSSGRSAGSMHSGGGSRSSNFGGGHSGGGSHFGGGGSYGGGGGSHFGGGGGGHSGGGGGHGGRGRH